MSRHKLKARHWPCRDDNRALTCSVKEALLLVQRFCCFYCMKGVTLPEATVDHVVPKAKGGTDAVTNLVVSCESCNRRKGTTDVPERLVQSRISFFNR